MRMRRILSVDSLSGLLVVLTLPAVAGCMSAFNLRERESDRQAAFSQVDRAAADRAATNGGREQAAVPIVSSTLKLPSPEETAPGEPPPVRLITEQSVGPTTPKDKRIVIYNAALRIVVREIDSAIRQTEALAAEFGGYVQEIRSESITIRVPVARYSEAVSRVEDSGRVVARQLDAADVTEEYVDLEARLKNARAVRERLTALLGKAEDVKAALEVEKELKRIGEEIERLEGKLELIRNRVAYSTIAASFERVFRTPPSQLIMKLPFRWLQELDPQRLAQHDW